jgi:hypothetical protein
VAGRSASSSARRRAACARKVTLRAACARKVTLRVRGKKKKRKKKRGKKERRGRVGGIHGDGRERGVGRACGTARGSRKRRRKDGG